MSGFRSLGRGDKWRVICGIIGLALLGALAFFDSPRFPEVQDALNQYPRVTGYVAAGLAVLVGYLYVLTRKSMRERRINESVTSIGLAGLVRPLLGVNLVLRELIQEQLETLLAAKAQHSKEQGATSPLKWTRTLIVDSSALEKIRNSHRSLDVADPESAKWELLDECVRDLVGSVRDWNTTLVLTDLGRQALFAVQTLRSDLQMIQARVLEGCEDTSEDMQVVRARVVFMAAAFEAASMPRDFRAEVVEAVGNADLDECFAAKTARLGGSPIVEGYLKPVPHGKRFNRRTGVMCNQLRTAQRKGAEESLERFYREQDDKRAKVGHRQGSPEATPEQSGNETRQSESSKPDCCGGYTGKNRECHPNQRSLNGGVTSADLPVA